MTVRKKRTAPKTRSEGELTLEYQLKVTKLSGWQAEFFFHPERTWRFDFAFPIEMLAVEVHGGLWSGGAHVRPQGTQRDMDKLNEAQRLGWTVLQFSTKQVEDGEALPVIETVLGMKRGTISQPTPSGSTVVPSESRGDSDMAQAKKTATKVPGDLGTYRNQKITSTEARLTNTGDGLSKAQEMDPIIYEPGSLVTVVTRARVGQHAYKSTAVTGTVVLVQTFIGGTSAVVDDDLVADVMNEMEARIRAMLDAKEGQMTLPGQDATTGRTSRRRGSKADAEAAGLSVVDGQGGEAPTE